VPKHKNTTPKEEPEFVLVEGHLVLAKDARLAKDIAILDKGWNNTEEGKAILKAAKAYKEGKHAK